MTTERHGTQDANLHSLVAAYAIDAVDETERRNFELHLDDCGDCRSELLSLASAVEELGAAQTAAIPKGLKADVMAEVARTAQLPPVVPATASTHAGPTPASAPTRDWAAASGDTPDELASRRHGRAHRARRTWFAAAGAAAAAVVVAVVGVTWADARAQHAADLALEKDVMMVTSAPDATSMDLELGAGHVVTSARMESLAVMGANAPMPEDGMAYQVWLVMADGTKVAGPTFVPHDDGEYMAVAEGVMTDVAAVAVTVEPPSGSDAPTSEPVCVTEMPGKTAT
ncbi:anti-sigma factor [Demequina sp. B12]|uniref:anti-sigma factor n=1 Tax=Demequina sp. B12 TaxID=2992757 RepID=UPI00237B2D55|nr:anti-sigma factor [Demequina sp. B12]MDE0573458.1 anti-sigma factor [Demequina sp. B12]